MKDEAETVRTAIDNLADLASGWSRPLDDTERSMAAGYAHQAGSEALDALESQNQALQERADELTTMLKRAVHATDLTGEQWRKDALQLLSPTQETDPG